jgi:hypothetical protein
MKHKWWYSIFFFVFSFSLDIQKCQSTKKGAVGQWLSLPTATDTYIQLSLSIHPSLTTTKKTTTYSRANRRKTREMNSAGHKKSCMGIDDEVLFCVFFLPGACRRRWISQKWRRRKCLEKRNYPTGRIERDGRIIYTGNNESVELLDCYNFCKPLPNTHNRFLSHLSPPVSTVASVL